MKTRLFGAFVLVPALTLGACAETTTVAQAEGRDALLHRLIEEEKVAHDLYTAFDEQYDAQVFSNITSGEVGHQDAVLRVIEAASLDDPRTGEPGVFADPELQTVYDDFLARGLASETEAYQVGVDFEKWDIAGLEAELAAAPAEDTELRDLLHFLIDGSERHLGAFERQLERPRGR